MSELIKNGKLAVDDWTRVSYPAVVEEVKKQAGKPVTAKLTGAQAASDEVVAGLEVPAAGRVLVPLAVWLARQDELAPRLAAGELGVWLDSFELVEDLVASVADINAFPVIALNFPKFADGRQYSGANLLRTRYGYRNELRAIGEVFRDYFFFMQRCGFDAWVPAAGKYNAAQIQEALAGLHTFSEPYQAAADLSQPVWRRHARGVSA